MSAPLPHPTAWAHCNTLIEGYRNWNCFVEIELQIESSPSEQTQSQSFLVVRNVGRRKCSHPGLLRHRLLVVIGRLTIGILRIRVRRAKRGTHTHLFCQELQPKEIT